MGHEPAARSAAPRIVLFTVVGALPASLIEGVIAAVSRRLSLTCRLAAEPWRGTPPRLPGSDQVDADALLDRLKAVAPCDGVVVGLTAHDLGIRLFTYVFGRAERHGRAAVISVARLDPAVYGLPADERITVRRAAVEVVHELGHTAGLGHCKDWGCIMRFASNVGAVDERGDDFCDECAGHLPSGFLPASARR